MEYHEVIPITRSQAEAQFATKQVTEIEDAIIRLAFHDPDWRWVQSRCIEYIRHPDTGVKATAALGFAHLARIHRQLDLALVLTELEALRSDPALSERIEDVLEDINQFLVLNRPKS